MRDWTISDRRAEAGGGLTPQVREFAPAKINLFLHVLGRRRDGFHDLDSLVAFADIGDEVELTIDGGLRITVDGPFAADVPLDETNLALRAARELSQALDREGGVHINLTKNLPVASGIGGGSADAAAVLRGLAKLWNTGPSMTFPSVAKALGADVPVCLLSRAARLSGIGDAAPIPFDDALDLVLVNCGIAISTATVFERLDRFSDPAPDCPEQIDSGWLSAQRNDLQDTAAAMAPQVDTVLSEIRTTKGCVFARMSGSGATCFGAYGSTAEAVRAADQLSSAHRAWWVRAVKVR